jgi:hypothetical protein
VTATLTARRRGASPLEWAVTSPARHVMFVGLGAQHRRLAGATCAGRSGASSDYLRPLLVDPRARGAQQPAVGSRQQPRMDHLLPRPAQRPDHGLRRRWLATGEQYLDGAAEVVERA